MPSTDEVTFWSITGQKLVTYSLSQYQPGGYYTLPQLVATQTGTNYYFGGKLVKNSTGYVTPDRLGSIGKYFPYGQERPSATTDGKEKFATYFRDSETGLDYANNRYHQPGMGRFMTADAYEVSNPKDPSSWNRYSYVEGDPVNYYDPRGQFQEVPRTPIQAPVELPGTHHIPGGEDPQCMILYLAAQGGNPRAQQMFERYCGSPAPGVVNQDDGGGVIHTPDVNNLRFEKEFDCAKSGTELFADLKDNFSSMASYQGRFGPGGVLKIAAIFLLCVGVGRVLALFSRGRPSYLRWDLLAASASAFFAFLFAYLIVGKRIGGVVITNPLVAESGFGCVLFLSYRLILWRRQSSSL